VLTEAYVMFLLGIKALCNLKAAKQGGRNTR